ncbi:hypothetical protein StoSoilB5_11740 [Arthrobacter sp. StoSoilB5]|nr:hypothetical protein StoSoilB5_11740 [Arthrobacter sp. StoSoilB5]
MTNTVFVTSIEGVTRIGGPAGAPAVDAGDRAFDVAVNTVTNKIYITTAGGYVSVVDGATYGPAVRVPMTAEPSVLAVNESSNKIYVGISGGVTVIDGATNATTTVPLTGGAQNIQVNPSTGKAYVLSGGAPNNKPKTSETKQQLKRPRRARLLSRATPVRLWGRTRAVSLPLGVRSVRPTK